MYTLIHADDFDNLDEIMCMSNLRGNKIKVPGKMPFSFYYSQKNSSHGIRVKPVFDPQRVDLKKLGTLKLCDDWKYTPGPDDKKINSKLKNQMYDFFRTYKVIFAGVWEGVIPEGDVYEYFRGIISLNELFEECDFYSSYSSELDSISTISEFENFVRENNVFNMND